VTITVVAICNGIEAGPSERLWKTRARRRGLAEHAAGLPRRPIHVTAYAWVHDPVKNETMQVKLSCGQTAPATLEEIAVFGNMSGNMSGKRAFVTLAVTAALGILGAASAAANEHNDRGRERGGSVMPCSLAGVNPVHHPEIFGNAAAAQSFGFVQAADRTWHVRADCRR
jgi:hypothetical protein